MNYDCPIARWIIEGMIGHRGPAAPVSGWPAIRRLTINVSALSDTRKLEECGATRVGGAFDKAVRTKPLAFAADAVGLWGLNVAQEGGGGRGSREGVGR